MDEESARKLNRMIRRDRLRAAIVPGLILSLLIGLASLYLYDQQIGQSSFVQATVGNWSRAQSESGSSGYIIEVTLSDGTRATATASRYGRTPKHGEHIQLVRTETQLGRLRYRWERQSDRKSQE